MQFIPMANPYIGEEEAKAVYQQVRSSWISMGKKVQELEQMVCEYTGARHAVAFNSGTATLHAALIALGVGAGDEVLVPSLSYISSANSVLFCGAKPVFVEEDPYTFNVSAEAVERKITSRTKVIMVVDLKGMPVDYDAIVSVAQKHHLPVLADSAESFGAKYKGRIIGTQADIHSFSLFANKNITSGEGGFITTNNKDFDRICRCVRNQGQSERYTHVMIGHNYRMTDVIAVIAIEQLKRVEWIMEQKNRLAQAYDMLFSDDPLLITPYQPDYVTRHSWYMYCLIVNDQVDRDAMLEIMRQEGVDSRLSFPPIPLQPVYRDLYGYRPGDFPKAEKIFSQFVDIPNWIQMDNVTLEKVAEVVKQAARKARRN